MDTDRIQVALSRFLSEHKVVFWSDPEKEFGDVLPTLDFSGATVIRVAGSPALETKLAIAARGSEDRFLIYEDQPRPVPAEDWLLDIRLYAKSFAADRSTHILEDLGLHMPALRDHIAQRSKFFASRDRLARFKRLVTAKDNEVEIDRKIMATLLKLENADFFGILVAIFDAFPDKSDISSPPEVFAEFAKYDVEASFWEQVRAMFGYDDPRPTLGNLLLRLLVTDFTRKLNGKSPKALEHLKLRGTGASNTAVCLARWQDSHSRHLSFDRLSDAVAKAIKLKDHIVSVDPEYLEDTRTFSLVERRLVSGLRDRIIDTDTAVDVDEVVSLCRRRKDGYWANEALGGTALRKAYARTYDALEYAARLFSLRGAYASGFSFSTAEDFWEAYQTDLYRFDQLYRHFCEAADRVENQGWDILKTLRQKVEDVYGNGYVSPLAIAWSPFASEMIGSKWEVPGVPSMSRFYERNIAPIVRDDDRRAIVLISDAFRFEAAKELADQINGRDRMEAKLTTQLGVLPSFTALGMASLLPHKDLGFLGGTVMVDGKSSSGMKNRGEILAKHAGGVIGADELRAMSVDEGRRFLKSHKVVYVYHNHIDKTADGADEEKAFDAVRRTIDDIASLAIRILGSLNGTNLFVTADHGFLYQESPPTSVDKNVVEDKPDGVVLAKKRYYVGTKLGSHPGAWAAPLSRTSNVRDETEFWVPKGTSRFHFMGGARFLHGGAMLQEICVPVMRIGYTKDRDANDVKARPVKIAALGTNLRITTPRRSFDLMQTEPISDRVRPITVTVAIAGPDGPVSDIQRVTFDSRTSSMSEDWKQTVRLSLSGLAFDKSQQYRLVVRNAETKVEELSQDVVIDLAIARDFD
ncbi:BREX-1 system phosphatase PglZ type A [Aurantimonas sp. A2-1-M11]|uniref:BREX-1 system phosphatase PglZ type A n=1 Tax=Aurantimonas sp. A2-1-M11 TaxID=3113712 RepID=UPI002F947BD5